MGRQTLLLLWVLWVIYCNNFQAELPYVARAKALRHELAESGSVEEKLAAKDKELQDARRALKLKVCLIWL
jgi:hypothetical protein